MVIQGVVRVYRGCVDVVQQLNRNPLTDVNFPPVNCSLRISAQCARNGANFGVQMSNYVRLGPFEALHWRTSLRCRAYWQWCTLCSSSAGTSVKINPVLAGLNY
eukprot:1161486-Pelagomonas_calceolata.AAC.8